ncbi:probable leucine-rich repeat receptor-like protein kinase At1g68400 [Miscanthus floridulus]|uniref:probable leucine-rich repeat receptor-like protein kinase At1g68400 n=1 Tax=Miscanthus floridulus TaxID=154761 RepID=UPI0034581C8F
MAAIWSLCYCRQRTVGGRGRHHAEDCKGDFSGSAKEYRTWATDGLLSCFRLSGWFFGSWSVSSSFRSFFLLPPALLADAAHPAARSSSLTSPLRVHRVVLEGLWLSGHAAALELLADLPVLSSLSLKNNTFTGALHGVDFSRLAPHLKLLYLSGNGFSGRFPEFVLHLRHLRRLDLSGNHLAGTIPPEIGHCLRALLTLNIQRNSFVGFVPDSLDAMPKLAELNVFGNHLEGRIPNRLAAAFPASSFDGNPGLYGAPLARRCNEPQQIVYNNGGGEASNGPMTTGRGNKIHDRWMVVRPCQRWARRSRRWSRRHCAQCFY